MCSYLGKMPVSPRHQYYNTLCRLKAMKVTKCSYRRFLLYEIRPATSHELNGLKNLHLLYTEPVWKRKIHKYISEQRRGKKTKSKVSSVKLLISINY